MSATAAKQHHDFLSSNWEKTSDYYTSDDLINAYIQGKNDQRDESKQILMKHLNENVKKATEIIEKFVEDLSKSYSITVKGINLKIVKISFFEFLFIVDNKSFVSDNFRNVYELSRKIKTENNNETFFISFIFMPDKKSVDTDAIHSDGFILEYVKTPSKSRTRRA